MCNTSPSTALSLIILLALNLTVSAEPRFWPYHSQEIMPYSTPSPPGTLPKHQSGSPHLDDDQQMRYQEAIASIRAGDYAIAYCALRPLAEQGDPHAQFNLGWLFHNGYGLAINNQRALEWWQKAAEQGHANASFALGMLYYHGDRLGETRVKQDIPKAMKFFLAATRQHHEDAKVMALQLVKHHHDELFSLVNTWGPSEWQLIGEAIIVTSSKANVRSGPGMDNPVIKVLQKGDQLIRINTRGRWLEIFLSDTQGRAWIHNSLTKPIGKAQTYSTTSSK